MWDKTDEGVLYLLVDRIDKTWDCRLQKRRWRYVGIIQEISRAGGPTTEPQGLYYLQSMRFGPSPGDMNSWGSQSASRHLLHKLDWRQGTK